MNTPPPPTPPVGNGRAAAGGSASIDYGWCPCCGKAPKSEMTRRMQALVRGPSAIREDFPKWCTACSSKGARHRAAAVKHGAFKSICTAPWCGHVGEAAGDFCVSCAFAHINGVPLVSVGGGSGGGGSGGSSPQSAIESSRGGTSSSGSPSPMPDGGAAAGGAAMAGAGAASQYGGSAAGAAIDAAAPALTFSGGFDALSMSPSDGGTGCPAVGGGGPFDPMAASGRWDALTGVVVQKIRNFAEDSARAIEQSSSHQGQPVLIWSSFDVQVITMFSTAAFWKAFEEHGERADGNEKMQRVNALRMAKEKIMEDVGSHLTFLAQTQPPAKQQHAAALDLAAACFKTLQAFVAQDGCILVLLGNVGSLRLSREHAGLLLDALRSIHEAEPDFFPSVGFRAIATAKGGSVIGSLDFTGGVPEEPHEPIFPEPVILPAGERLLQNAAALRKKEMTEAGLFNPASPWQRYTNGYRAFYQRRRKNRSDPSRRVVEQSLEQPAEGVKNEEALDDEQFEKFYAVLLRKKQMTEAGLLKPDSPWTRFTNGGRCFYQRLDPVEQTLEEPAAGVKDEEALDDENFEKNYVAGTLADGTLAAALWPLMKKEMSEAPKQAGQMRVLQFEKLEALGRIPHSSDKDLDLVDYDSLTPRRDFCVVFVTHLWLRPKEHQPDDDEKSKWTLIMEGVKEMLPMLKAKSLDNVYVWIDFCCIDQDKAKRERLHPLLDTPMPEIIERCDAIFTPVVDDDNSWSDNPDIKMGRDLFDKAYGAAAWKQYLTRGWCRAEAFLAAARPTVAESAPFKADVLQGKRPHLLFGSNELQQNGRLWVLPALSFKYFEHYNPVKGAFTVEADRSLVRSWCMAEMADAPYSEKLDGTWLADGETKAVPGAPPSDGKLHKGVHITDESHSGSFTEHKPAPGWTLEGTFLNGKLHGDDCTETKLDYTIKSGSFKNGFQHGPGEQKFASGASFKGPALENGNRIRGEELFASGELRYDGAYHPETNKRHGQGKMWTQTIPDYSLLVSHGQGHQLWFEGVFDQGEPVPDEANTQGQSVYDGEYKWKRERQRDGTVVKVDPLAPAPAAISSGWMIVAASGGEIEAVEEPV